MAPGEKPQARPHMPQCHTLVRVSVSHPLSGFPSQSPKKRAHPVSTHCPPIQLATPWGLEHRFPQKPQLARVLSDSQALVSASQ